MNRRAQAGVTLVELVVSMVLIALSVSGGLLAISTTVRGSPAPNRVQQAVALAEGYLEEIRLQPVDDPDGAGGETRSQYDNVLDYGGLDESPPRDQSGATLTGLDDYRVRVTVAQSGALGPAGTQLASANTYRVDVRVTYFNDIDFTLSTYRARY